MAEIKSWRGLPIDVAKSAGGVLAVADPWDNVIKTGVRPWPPPELIQKIYESRQVRAYAGAELALATSKLGFYSDLQSLHSEDAITWSFFGPVAYATQATRGAFVKELLELIEVQGSSDNAHLWLWRRLPHPDTLVPGGPEIDFGIQTADVFLLGEAKWRSPVGRGQGVNRDKTQMTLREEFCQKYGTKLLSGTRHFVILGVSWNGGITLRADTETDGIALHARDTTWEGLARIASHPCAEEVRTYLVWKTHNSKPEPQTS
jgi:hypothetical protein